MCIRGEAADAAPSIFLIVIILYNGIGYICPCVPHVHFFNKRVRRWCVVDSLMEMLEAVPRSYEDFVVTVLSYVKNDKSKLQLVSDYIDSHPDDTPSDILGFLLRQPDFLDSDSDEETEDTAV